MAFYLKYRPQKLDDLDLASVRDALKKIAASDDIPHAFLFAGPKGTGKTSAARILAKIVNCEKRKKDEYEPCGECEQCLSIVKGNNIDVIEMDAASHRGIDDVRTLKDAVKLAPNAAKKKVYIIDEAHMLTTEASNALLKTLEEPPDHVMFILATTNPEKLIPTIRSRTVRVAFTKATEDEIVASLSKKVKAEKIDVPEDVLKLIASLADGAFRDADKMLEQLVLTGEKITKEMAEKLLSVSSDVFDTKAFIKLLSEKDAKALIQMLDGAVESGTPASRIAESVLEALRAALRGSVGVGDAESDLDKASLVKLLKLFGEASTQIGTSFIEHMPLEIAIVEWCSDTNSSAPAGGGEPQGEEKEHTNGHTNGHTDTTKLHAHAQPIDADAIKKEDVPDTPAPAPKKKSNKPLGKEIAKDVWAQILAEVRAHNASTEALLRASQPMGLDGNTLRLGVFYRFHKEHLESNAHRRLLEDVCGQILGETILVACELAEAPKKEATVSEIVAPPAPPAPAAPPAQAPPAPGQESSSTLLTEGDDEDIIRIAEELFND